MSKATLEMFHAYKVLTTGGTAPMYVLSRGYPEVIVMHAVVLLAQAAMIEIARMQEGNPLYEAKINFTPPADIEYLRDGGIWRCVRFIPAEEDVFWSVAAKWPRRNTAG